uniref:HhH-GPD domain-containing protein n=1 Tax=Physcomitrium patens TaxID=3218 RepID=A0A7I4D1J3_PHYPA
MFGRRSCHVTAHASDGLVHELQLQQRFGHSFESMPYQVALLMGLTRRRKRRNHVCSATVATERNKKILTPVPLIRKDHSWGHQAAIAGKSPIFAEAFAGSSLEKEGARTESWIAGEEQLKCYSRRKFRQLRVPAEAPPSEEVCEENACQENACQENVRIENFSAGFCEDFGQFDCEEHPKSPPLSTTSKLTGLRSIRRRRDKPLRSLPQILKEIIREDGRKKDTPPDPQIRRPQRRRRENPRYSKDCFRSTDTAEYDWDIFYPELPFEHVFLHGSGMQLGEVETITNSEDGNSSDISAHVEKPVPLKSQFRDSRRTRKARKIFGDGPLLATPIPDVVHVLQSRPAVPVQPPEVDEVFIAPQTPDPPQESNGECEVDRNLSLQNESALDEDSCWTPSKCDVARKVHTRLQVSRSRQGDNDRTQLHLVVELSGSPTIKSVKVKKKRIRPRVKQPKKVKISKSPKIPKISKASKRNNAFPRGTLEHNDATANPKEAKALRKPPRTNERVFSSSPVDSTLIPVVEVPNIDRLVDEALVNYYASNEGEICTQLPMVEASRGTSNRHECTVDIEKNCAQPATAQVGESNLGLNNQSASKIATEEIPVGSDDQQTLNRPVIRCIPNFGDVPVLSGSWMEEDPPSTPRANALIVHPANVLNSPSFPLEEESCEDSLDSEDEQTGPSSKRRKGPILTRRTRRSLLPVVEAELNDLAPLRIAAPVTPPHFSILEISETQKKQHVWALCQNQQYSEDPMGLVKKLTTGAPKHLLEAETCELVKDDVEKIFVPEDTPIQKVYSRRRTAVHFPQPLNSREFAAEDELQLVVYGQKSNEMVSYRGMRPKVKCKPKVFLDEVTIKTFERLLLQGGEASDADRTDENWAEQRQLWGGRAHSFNAVMRDVQGDRTFSKWGGSVLDSVVGVFLTQNVSDFLSSNAFMELCARFPVRRDATTGSCVASKEQSLLSKEMSRECPVETPDPYLTRALHPRAEGSAAGIDELQQKTAGAQDDSGQVITEVCVAETPDTLLKKPQEAKDILVDLPTRDDGHRDLDISDPYSLSDGHGGIEALSRSIAIDNLAVALETVHIQSSAVPKDCCSFMKMTTTNVRAPDEHVTDDADYASRPQATKIVSEMPGDNRVQESIGTEAGTQGPTQDVGEKRHSSEQGCLVGNDEKSDTRKPFSRGYSVLQDKFKLSLEEDLTPDRSEKLLATALRHILGKSITAREAAVVKEPLKIEKRRKLKSSKNARHVSKISVKELTGGQRATYEHGFNYKLNAEMKTTWEALRAKVLSDNFEKDYSISDSVDWEAVRLADVAVVADLIKERGMNNILSGRIKSLLDRIYRDQDGSLDLEWIRKLSPIDSQNFLINVRGLGIKSVECIRLLTLHHPSFPVDTNVGRILVRLGWVPLEPLPEKIRLHLLEMYPVQEQIQKYIWPRLCTLDQQTLYEFHYQLITFGKVFCTKSKPNCSACPMRGQCKHFESAVSSSRPLLQGSERASNHSMQQIVPLIPRHSMQHVEETPSLLTSGEADGPYRGACIPIIEEPCSPEPDCVQDIEDVGIIANYNNNFALQESNRNAKLSTSDNVAVSGICGDGMYMHLSSNDTLTQNICLGEEKEAGEDGDDSEEICCKRVALKAALHEAEVTITEECVPQLVSQELAYPPSQELILLPPYAASFPAPLLKSVQRLRTIHYVYELPDHHPLLHQAKMDKRDSDDPCLYLLAIWNADEVPAAMPKISDDDASNPFASCNSGQEVPGTILVPCRTANKGSFPLNGTYFQVNEVFADHASSHDPLRVSRTLMWNLKRKFVYFGTSVTSIFRDMSQGEIQCCFKKGYVCVRAFDQATRKPKPLAPRLHQSAAKIVAARAGAQRSGRRASTSRHIKIHE